MGIAAFVVMLGGEHNVHRGAFAGLFLATGWGFVGVGLWVWKQRPAGNIGPLMVAVGLSGLLKGLAFSNDSVVFAIASVGEVLIYAVLIHLLLSFPVGEARNPAGPSPGHHRLRQHDGGAAWSVPVHRPKGGGRLSQ